MNYCTYPEYQAAGGTVSELAFGVLCSRASRLIDSATFGKAEPHAAVCESCRQMLADACAQIVDLLAAQLAVGAAPGAVAIGLGKLLRIRTIWVDSIANVRQISRAGRLIQRQADVFLTQWEHLSDGQQVLFKGAVL